MKVEEILRSVGGLQRTIEFVRESFQHVLCASDHIVRAVHQQSNASRDMSDRMRTLNSRLDRHLDDLKQLMDHMQLTIKK
jgi:methyl-accepting chemotaxis protein